MTYEKVLNEVENAEEEAKRAKRLPRSYEESDKKLKTVKIVTKKGDVAKDEKKPKKPKQMAASNKQAAATVEEEEIELPEDGQVEEAENLDEQKKNEEIKEEESSSMDQEENERIPLVEVQQPTMTIAEKLQAAGRIPAPYSKASASYEKKTIFNFSSIEYLFIF